ncbi:MAG TPA: hypothetical protein VF707_06920, partial [Ardenticatenaceae bacterium]
MRHVLTSMIALLLFAVSLVGCASTTTGGTVSNGDTQEAAIVQPMVEASNTPDSCGQPLANEAIQQADFHGLLAGESSIESMLHELGEPTKTDSFSLGEEEYVYFPVDDSTGRAVQYNVYVKDGTVDSIVEGFANEAYDNPANPPSLSEMTTSYGCPDLVFLVSFGEEPSDTYHGAYLLYPQTGIELLIEGLPLT